jgi:hypothetical protein
MIWRTLPLIGVVATIQLGCKKPVTSSDLVGSYRMTKPGAEDVLDLQPDGRYIHRFATSGVATSADTNRWTLEGRDGEQRVVFSEFLMRAPKEGDSTLRQTRGLWSAEVSRNMKGDFRFVVNDDLGWYYVRERSGH